MKSYALLDLNSAEILQGRRITFIDNNNGGMKEYGVGEYKIGFFQCDGWLIYHPKIGQWSIFMNIEWVERMFENLGEV
jgi:hypothetical protein